MLTTTFASGFGSNFIVTSPETIYPAFSQVVVFDTASTGTRIKLPDYVNTVRILAWGGGGASGARGPTAGAPPTNPATVANFNSIAGGARAGGNGGDGGFVQADIPITPGTILKVRVAGGGPAANVTYGGSGGGYSSVELPSSFPNYHLVVAGGGGGGGNAPTLTALTPWSGDPQGYYYPGNPGYSAFTGSPGNLGGGAGSLVAGGRAGYMPIGAVPVPTLGPYLGPIYGPLPPSSPPVRASANGAFLTGGGNFSGQTGGINGGGLGYYQIPNPAWGVGAVPPAVPPTSPFRPTRINYSSTSGGGGGGYYGGGMAHPNSFISGGGWQGDWGGGGGSSYINPAASNTAMANTGPYAPNPYYSAYANPARLNATGGSGVGIPGQSWSSIQGGDGLVVIIY